MSVRARSRGRGSHRNRRGRLACTFAERAERCYEVGAVIKWRSAGAKKRRKTRIFMKFYKKRSRITCNCVGKVQPRSGNRCTTSEHRPEPQNCASGSTWDAAVTENGQCEWLPQRNGEIFIGARPKVCGLQRSGESWMVGARASRARVLWGVSVWREDAAITKTE